MDLPNLVLAASCRHDESNSDPRGKVARYYVLIGLGATSLALGCNTDPHSGQTADASSSSASGHGSSGTDSAEEPPVTDSLSEGVTGGESIGETSSGSASSGGASAPTTNGPTSTGSTASSSSTSSTEGTASTGSDVGSASTDGLSTGGADTGEPAICGDGVVAGDEACDDGNNEGLDGCSADCISEAAIAQVCAGPARTCVVDTLGRVKCWGANLYGELGIGGKEHRGDDPGEMGAGLPFVDLAMEVDTIACQGQFCALGTEGQVKCWGGPTGSYLGLGTMEGIGDDPEEMGAALPAVELGEPALQLANSGRGACALLVSGKLKCWGFNGSGQLGLGDTEIRGDEPGEMGLALPPVNLGQLKPVQIMRSHLAKCAVDVGGAMKCWGMGELLGLESPEDRGDQPGEMGNTLPFVNVGTGAKVAQASASSAHVCVVLVDGRLKCWGQDEDSNVLWPFGNGMVSYGSEPGQMGDSLPAYELGEHEAVAVEAGHLSSCVLLDDQSVKCWGSANHGIMGNGSPAQWLGDPLSKVPAIDLGVGEVVTQLSHSYLHACALLASGHIKCWGSNGAGELGYEDDNDRGDEPNEMGEELPYVEVF